MRSFCPTFRELGEDVLRFLDCMAFGLCRFSQNTVGAVGPAQHEGVCSHCFSSVLAVPPEED